MQLAQNFSPRRMHVFAYVSLAFLPLAIVAAVQTIRCGSSFMAGH